MDFANAYLAKAVSFAIIYAFCFPKIESVARRLVVKSYVANLLFSIFLFGALLIIPETPRLGVSGSTSIPSRVVKRHLIMD